MPLQAPIKIQNQGTDVGTSYTINAVGPLATGSLVSGVGTITIAGLSGSSGYVQFNSGTNTFDSDVAFSFNKTTDVLTLTGAVALGVGTVAAAGLIRLPYNGGAALSVMAGRGSGGADENIIQWGAGDSITMGDPSCDYKINAFGSNTLVAASGGWTIGAAGVSNALVLGASLNSMVNPLAVGSSPSTTGTIRLPSGGIIKSRDAANTADKPLMQFTSNILLIGTDPSYSDQVDRLDIYSSTGGNVYMGNGGLTRLSLNAGGVTLYSLNDPLTFGYTGAASQGMIRLPGGSRFQMVGRNNANNGDIAIISQNTNDEIFLGTSNTYTTQASNVRAYAGSNVFLGTGSSTQIQVTSGLTYMFGNTALGNQTPTLGGASGAVYVGNATTVPSTNPTLGVVLYSTGERLKYRSSDGYVMSLDTVDPTVNGFRLSASISGSIPTADVTSTSVLYLQPHNSTSIALWDGTDWRLNTVGRQLDGSIPQLSLSGLTAGKNYDVFAYRNGIAVALELGTAWTSDTARAVAIVRQNGVYVKSGDPTRRYIGTFRATSATATVDTARQRFVYNENNQVRRFLLYQLNIASYTWNSATTTIRQANAQTGTNSYRVEFVMGNSEYFETRLETVWTAATVGVAYYGQIGIDSTTVNSGWYNSVTNYGKSGQGTICNCSYAGVLATGYHSVYWLESVSGTANFALYGNTGTAGQSSILRGTIDM